MRTRYCLAALILAVSLATASAGTSFPIQILPILTKAGCNSGACHGAATGQGGFKLSLLGYDAGRDFETITRELSGRRIDLAQPAESLFLRKPTGQLEHEGGRRLPRTSEDYATLMKWLGAGTPYGPPDLQVTGIKITPGDTLLLAPGQSRPLRVQATLSNGTKEDVTRHVLFSSNDDGLAEVDKSGLVTVHQRGVTAIMVRYGGQVAAVRVGAAFADKAPKTGSFKPAGFIDEIAAAEWKRFQVPPSGLSDDATFLRRVHLDLVGRLPSPDEVEEFLGGGKGRTAVIDRLLASPEFTDYWTFKFADLLLVNSKKMGDDGARAYHIWLREQIAANTPLDRLVRELITALGNPAQTPPANFLRVATDPRDMGEFVSQTLLGARIACARCHNHPLDRWTMDDYHHFAAFFARTGLDNGRLVQRDYGEVQHPKTGKEVVPRVLMALSGDSRTAFPLTPALSPGEREKSTTGRRNQPAGEVPTSVRKLSPLPKGEGQGEGKAAERTGTGSASDSARPQTSNSKLETSEADRRLPLAEWLASPDNPMFARALANRVWRELLGRGLVEPVDDLRPTNPPSIPDLLDALAADFAGHGFDLRRLIRAIVTSRTYQLASQTNEINRQDDRLFSHAYPKPLTGPVLADALSQALGVPDVFTGQETATRAVQLVDSQVASYSLDVFGRCPRTMACADAGQYGGGLSQALHLINGPVINAKLPLAAKSLLAAGATDRELIEQVYLRTLSRHPTGTEAARWADELAKAADKAELVQDLLWALLNSREFGIIH